MNKTKRIVNLICRWGSALILLQTLFFKFTGAEESIYIFTKVGMEPWGRYATGSLELVAAILLFSSCHAWLGALLALGVICGALFSHLTVLGISVKGDHGLLFGLAVAVFVMSGIVAYLNRAQIPFVSQWLKLKTA
jgi:uncharacterized membrane protein YphA (DoxX/SURF4 family)